MLETAMVTIGMFLAGYILGRWLASPFRAAPEPDDFEQSADCAEAIMAMRKRRDDADAQQSAADAQARLSTGYPRFHGVPATNMLDVAHRAWWRDKEGELR